MGQHRRRSTLPILVVATALVVGMVLIAPASASPRSVDVVVVLDAPPGPGAAVAAQATARQHGVEVGYLYEHALTGFSGRVPEGRLEALRRDPRVRSVEPDLTVTLVGQQVPTGVQRVFAHANDAIPTDGTSGGAAVDATVAVLDTGVDANHPDLDVVASWDCTLTTGGGAPWSRTAYCGAGGNDVNGHGTHVAGTVAAQDNDLGVVGVAPGARIWSVKVLGDDGGGTISGVIAGVDLVTANAGSIDVANMSLSASGSHSGLESAISNSVGAGVTYVVAAGNSARDVSNETPAGHPDVLTVAALADYDGFAGGLADPTCRDSGGDDTFATFSNFGAGVDLLAPGVCIRSTVPGGGYATYSGTSMAAPHVAGAAALLASTGLLAEPEVRTGVLAATNTGWATGTAPAGTTDRLLDVGELTPDLVDGDPGDGGGEQPPGDGGGDPGEDPDDPDVPEPDEPVLEDGVTLTGASSNLPQGRWRATVTATVVTDGALASGTVVSFASTSHRGASGIDSCSTGADGRCSVSVDLPNRDGHVTFTVTSPTDGPSVSVSKP